jgi:glucose/arabinose dehydrogenase
MLNALIAGATRSTHPRACQGTTAAGQSAAIGRPEGYYENFATGFWVSGERRAEVWGRPAALAVAKDGSLLVADDTGGTIWRIAYTGSGSTESTGSR